MTRGRGEAARGFRRITKYKARNTTMAETDYQVEAIGEIYAQALIHVAQKQNVLPAVQEDIASLDALLKSGGLFRDFVQAADIASEMHRQILEKMFSGKVHQLTLETLKSMAARNRLMFLGGMINGFKTIIGRQSGRIEVDLVSASELSPDLIERLRVAVNKATGHQPEFKTEIDPSLIGGVRVKIGDTLIDASVEAQLEKIRRQLQTKGLERMQKSATVVASA